MLVNFETGIRNTWWHLGECVHCGQNVVWLGGFEGAAQIQWKWEERQQNKGQKKTTASQFMVTTRRKQSAGSHWLCMTCWEPISCACHEDFSPFKSLNSFAVLSDAEIWLGGRPLLQFLIGHRGKSGICISPAARDPSPVKHVRRRRFSKRRYPSSRAATYVSCPCWAGSSALGVSVHAVKERLNSSSVFLLPILLICFPKQNMVWYFGGGGVPLFILPVTSHTFRPVDKTSIWFICWLNSATTNSTSQCLHLLTQMGLVETDHPQFVSQSRDSPWHHMCDCLRFPCQAFPDNAARREIEGLPASCPSEGCNWKGIVKDYEVYTCFGFFFPADPWIK